MPKETRKLYYFTCPQPLAQPQMRKGEEKLSEWRHTYLYALRPFIAIETEEQWRLREALDKMYLDTLPGDVHETTLPEREAMIAAMSEARKRMPPEMDMAHDAHWRAIVLMSTERPKALSTPAKQKETT